MAGGIAHDFNNLLTIFIGNISLVKQGVKPEHENFEILLECEEAAWNAQKLTQQLMTFAKGGAPVKQTASIRKTVKDSAKFILRGSNVRCDFDMSEDLWLIRIDAGQISQTIQNLIINADQAMPQGGTIQVRVKNITLDATTILPVQPGADLRGGHLRCSGRWLALARAL